VAATQTWIELQVELPAEMAELVAAELAELVGGVEIRDPGTLFATAPDRAAVVALCEPEAVDEALATIDDVLAIARAAGTTVDPVAIRRREAHEDEWRDVWKQFFRTTRIGTHFVVRPSWEPPVVDPGNDHVIDLDPGRAFGTGAHPSTQLVIRAMEGLAAGGFAPASFLDLGCGSGILAIAAQRLWPAARGLAVDNDPEATACTAENFARNDVGTVAIETGTLADVTGTFDLVIANIQRDVLEVIAGEVPARLTPARLTSGKAHVVLSGLLTSDADPVRVVYEGLGLRLVQRNDEGEWASLVLARV
jgi:ribosomal protein L11 methyltransferase